MRIGIQLGHESNKKLTNKNKWHLHLSYPIEYSLTPVTLAPHHPTLKVTEHCETLDLKSIYRIHVNNNKRYFGLSYPIN